MYLSRLELDLTKRDTMRALASPSLFHGAIEAAFPHERSAPALGGDGQMSLFETFGGASASFSTDRERKLWRVDALRGKTYLLLLSRERPNLSEAARQFGTGARWETKSYSPFLGGIRDGEILRFRLTANPTVSRSSPKSADGEKARGTVYAHITTEHQRQWLLQKSERHGFRLTEDDFDVTESRWRTFRKGAERNRRVALLSVTYEGTLEVTDADAFREALSNGIGRGKAYGMGLLTVIRTGARPTFSPHTRG